MKILEIKNLVPCQCLLGEGPVWIAGQRMLYWVDILQNTIFSYSPSTHKLNSWKTTEYIGFVLVMNNNQVIGGLKSGLHYLTLNNDGTAIEKRIDYINKENKTIRFNDGIMDGAGGIICCTMDMLGKGQLGKYYYYHDNFKKRNVIDKGYTIANGPAIGIKNGLLYTVESVGSQMTKKGIYVSEFNKNSATITNKKLLIEWQKQSSPDGIVIDKNGGLWVGEFGGNILRCFDPNGSLKHEIPLPGWNITKAAFNYRGNKTSIYVTSAIFGASKKTLKMYPNTGDVLEIICQL